MIIAKFKPEHLDRIELQDSQADDTAMIADPEYRARLMMTDAYTVFIGGEVMLCAGVSEIFEHRAVAWSLVSRHAGKEFRVIHRAVDGFLRQCKYDRVEMMVKSGFVAGERWAKLLGMEKEGLMRMCGPDKQDYFMYARIR